MRLIMMPSSFEWTGGQSDEQAFALSTGGVDGRGECCVAVYGGLAGAEETEVWPVDCRVNIDLARMLGERGRFEATYIESARQRT